MKSLLSILTAFLIVPAALSAEGILALKVLDAGTRKPVPCRVHFLDEKGKPHRPAGFPFWRDHFVCSGDARLTLVPGRYQYEIERGPEYALKKGLVNVQAGTQELTVTLDQLVSMNQEGWWSGDLHVHRPVKDVPLLMQAEDLNIAPVITWWNNRNEWKRESGLPKNLLIQLEGNRFYHLMAGEDERGGGALLYFNLQKPLPIAGSMREHPSSVKFLREARMHKRVHIDVEKPFWWDVPLWLATEQIDSMGLANNHMCRSQMYESEAWGKPRDVKRLPPPRGNGFWTQEIYYHVLNSGLRIPPSAGSASGVLPNPLGYNRVYVHVEGKLTWEKWWQGLRAGRSFVTNGPLLRVKVNGQLPGHVFTAGAGKLLELTMTAKLTTRDPIDEIQVVKNGKVERRISIKEFRRTGSLGKIQFTKSGWLLVRVIASNRKTFRFASSAPFYVEVGPVKRIVHKESVQFFLKWISEREKQLTRLPNADQRKAVLKPLSDSRKFWKRRLEQASESP